MKPEFLASADFAHFFQIIVGAARCCSQRARDLLRQKIFLSPTPPLRHRPRMEWAPFLYPLGWLLREFFPGVRNAHQQPADEHEPWRLNRLFRRMNEPRADKKSRRPTYYGGRVPAWMCSRPVEREFVHLLSVDLICACWWSSSYAPPAWPQGYTHLQNPMEDREREKLKEVCDNIEIRVDEPPTTRESLTKRTPPPMCRLPLFRWLFSPLVKEECPLFPLDSSSLSGENSSSSSLSSVLRLGSKGRKATGKAIMRPVGNKRRKSLICCSTKKCRALYQSSRAWWSPVPYMLDLLPKRSRQCQDPRRASRRGWRDNCYQRESRHENAGAASVWFPASPPVRRRSWYRPNLHLSREQFSEASVASNQVPPRVSRDGH